MDLGNEWPGEVISLKGCRQNMAYNPIAEVEAYWEALRGVRTVPLRSDVDPRGIERALDHTFLVERIAPGLARFRLAGKQLNDVMGMEVRGMPLTACFQGDAREQVREVMNHLFEGPAVIRMGLTAERGLGRPKLDAQLILLPLKSDLGDVSRAMGCLCLNGKIGRAPRKFVVEAISRRPTGPFRPQPLDTRHVAPESSGFSEQAAQFEASPKRKERPKLRVIEGGNTKG